MHKDNCKTRGETFRFWDLVQLILESWQYIYVCVYMVLLTVVLESSAETSIWYLRESIPWLLSTDLWNSINCISFWLQSHGTVSSIFYHDMQIRFRLSTNPIAGFLIGSVPKPCLVPVPTTVKLPHASGHSSGNCQGHVTKTKTHGFKIFVAFRFINV